MEGFQARIHFNAETKTLDTVHLNNIQNYQQQVLDSMAMLHDYIWHIYIYIWIDYNIPRPFLQILSLEYYIYIYHNTYYV